jgi:amino acid transporter
VIVQKDVILAILGASAALAGFVLVFLGIIIASYQSYSGGVPEQVVDPYRTLGRILLGAFGLCLIAVLVCLVWLVGGGPNQAYGPTVALFVAELVAVFGAAVWATRIVLWR